MYITTGSAMPQDWVSPVVTLAGWKPGVGAEPQLNLERRMVEDPKHAEAFAKLKQAATADVAQYEEFESPLLTRFWGRPDQDQGLGHPAAGVRARARSETYPTAYWTHGFGGDIDRRAGVWAAPLRTHEERQDAAHDLGDARRVHSAKGRMNSPTR